MRSVGDIPAARSGKGLALVLWNGDVGGAEVLNSKLADRMRKLGVDVTILFVGTPWPLAGRLAESGIPYCSLGFGRGRDVLLHPRRYAEEVARVGADGALLMERGFMASALRLGGYSAPIVAVEHGSLLVEMRCPLTVRRLMRQAGRLTGAWADDSEVAVSDFMLEVTCQHAHARRTRRIYNGVDPDVYKSESAPGGSELVVGFAGRLVAGKGADHLIRAVDRASRNLQMKLLIAGEGPERARLEHLTQELGASSRVEFLGTVEDIPGFWQSCDIASIPSDGWVESFSMVTLEAMSCGRAIVASKAGAIPELVLDGLTGTLVTPGDVDELAGALSVYGQSPALRKSHGEAARARAMEHFDIEDCARAYVELFDELAAKRSARTGGMLGRLRRRA